MSLPLLWEKIRASGDQPSARFGHSMNAIGKRYVMFGGQLVKDDLKNEATHPETTDEVYTLRIEENEAHWQKEKIDGRLKPVSRSQHTAVAVGEKKIFVFGGYCWEDTKREERVELNDSYVLDTEVMQWSEAVKEEETKEERLVPSPRYGTASCIVDGKIYIFGGHQGYGDKRKSLKDFWSFDIGTGVWDKIECKGNSCESRGGHSMFAIGAKVYIYGG